MSQWRRIDKKSISTPDFEGFKKIVYRNRWNSDIPIQNATGNLRDKAFAWYVAIYSPMDLNAKKYRIIARYTSDVPCGTETPEKLGNDKPIPPSILRTYLEEKKKELAEPLALHVSWKKQINVKDIYATDVDGDQCSFDFELEEPGIPFETDNLGYFEPLGVLADDFNVLSVMIQYPDKVKSIANARDTFAHLVTCRDFQNDVKNKYWDEKIDDAKDDMFSWQSKLEKLDKDFEKSSEKAARALNKLSSKFNIEFSDIDVDSTIMVYSWMTPLKWKIGDQNPNMRVTGNSKSFLLPPMGFSDFKGASMRFSVNVHMGKYGIFSEILAYDGVRSTHLDPKWIKSFIKRTIYCDKFMKEIDGRLYFFDEFVEDDGRRGKNVGKTVAATASAIRYLHDYGQYLAMAYIWRGTGKIATIGQAKDAYDLIWKVYVFGYDMKWKYKCNKEIYQDYVNDAKKDIDSYVEMRRNNMLEAEKSATELLERGVFTKALECCKM